MRRRLSESARELIDTKEHKEVIDIVLDYRFKSFESYYRAFERMFAIQPDQLRKQGKLDRRFLMSKLTIEHIRTMNRGEYLKPVLVEKDAFHVAGVMTLVRDGGKIVSELWEIFLQELEDISHRVTPDSYYGIKFYPLGWEDIGYLYMAATEVEPSEMGNPFLAVKKIPQLRYARFIHKGLLKDIGLSLDYIYQTWLPKSGRFLSSPLEVLNYRRSFPGSDDQESEIEIYIPVE